MEQISVADRDGALWISLSGELDQQEVLDLKAEFDQAIADAETDVVLDLSGVTFIGTLGIGLIVSTREKIGQRGRKMKLSGVPASIERTFTIMSLTEVFERV